MKNEQSYNNAVFTGNDNSGNENIQISDNSNQNKDNIQSDI